MFGPKFGAPTLILCSFDEARAKAFYVDFPGFEPRMPLYMGLRKGGCELHLSEHYGEATLGSALRIPVDDVSAHIASLCAKNFGNARPGESQETPWGSREITITDPVGNRLTFYTDISEGSALK